MLKFYQLYNNTFSETKDLEENCFINLHNPSSEETDFVSDLIDIPNSIIIRMLDPEERSRIDVRDNYILGVINMAFSVKDNLMDVAPIGIIICKNYFVCISTKAIDPIGLFDKIDNKSSLLGNKINLFISLFYVVSRSYVSYTRTIIKKFEVLEERLIESNNNIDMLEALKLQKTLTFFSMALYSNDLVINRIINLQNKKQDNLLDFANINDELLDDAYTENKQAIEMVDTYSKIIIDLMNTIASIVANNQNNFLKLLTNITILLTIPMILAGLWGMNVKIPFEGESSGFWIVIGLSLGLMVLSLYYLWKKNLLK
ncbi:MAG: magnesium transporter CorA family protein [Alphaproteobacteria bacterium]|jgi:magnesium transporter|nr:magnesium transporter CorA family protein [Alphaproteobacteria bacterium]